MTPFLFAAYIAGIVCLLGVGAQARKRKPGRHRATGPSTLELATQSGSWLATLVPVAVLDVAPICPPMYPPIGDRYAHKSGVGRYAHLRIDELNATAERKLRLADFEQARRAQVVDLVALRVRGAVPTVAEVDDEWLAAVAS